MLIQWDKELLLLLNGSDSTYIDSMMWSVTHTATWVPMFVLLVYFLFKCNDWRNFLLTIAFIALVVTCCDQFSSGFCKPFFHRFRPTHDPEIGALVDVVNGYRGGQYGFISSHAANTFGVAVFLILLFRRRILTITLLLWAMLCSYSRIYLGVHFPLDILSGAMFGTLVGSVMYSLFMWLRSRYSEIFTKSSTQCPHRYCMLFCLSFFLTCVYIGVRALCCPSIS